MELQIPDGLDPIDALARLGDGHLIEDLMGEVADVGEAVMKKAARTGGKAKGKVTLTFEVEKAPGTDPTLLVSPSIKSSVPGREPAGRQYYLVNGEFHNSDPRQIPLKTRVVETPEPSERSTAGAPATAREV